MLPQIGSTELLVIAAIALIVVGPKDLPVLLRKLGKFVGRLRNMANDFRSSFDEMARQSELDDLRKEVAAMRDAAAAEKASVDTHLSGLDNQIHGGFEPSMPQMVGDPDYDPESYLRYPESPAEKIIKRRARVAEAEGAEKAAKTAKKAAPKLTVTAAAPKAPRKPRAKA